MTTIRISHVILAACVLASPAAAQQQKLGTQQPLSKQLPLSQSSGGATQNQQGTGSGLQTQQQGSSLAPDPQQLGKPTLRVTNLLGQPVASYYLDAGSQQIVPVATIGPGAAENYDVQANQVWIFGVDQKEIQRYMATAAPQQTVTIGRASLPQQPQQQSAGGSSQSQQTGRSGHQTMANAGPVVPPVILTPPTPLNPQSSSDGSFPTAQSWGGVIRSGPGLDFDRLGSVAEGTPIEILARTGDMMNGYSWFQIRYGNGVGYQWGGIICGVGQPIDGAFEVCN
jgi:hypothetical protein